MFSGIPRRIIFLLIFVDLMLMIIRFLCQSFGYPALSRIFTLLFIELAMLLVSTFMYKRIVGMVPKNKSHKFWPKPAKTAMIFFALSWVILAHSCWVWFYLPMPPDFFVGVMCFLAMGAYIHGAVLLFAFFFIERITHLAAPKVTNMLLRGETFHTLLSIGFALLLTTHGFLVTSRKPLIRNVNVNIKDLPQEFEGFSIALLTDIHIGPSVGRARMIDTVQVVNQIHPDLVVISGDLVDGYVSYLKSRAAPLADMNSVYGTYFVTGNHEYMHEDVDHWLKYFKDDLNITTLKNQGVLLTKNDKKICLSGVDDVYTEHIHLPGHMMDINRALDDCPDKVPTIMLVHQPNGASRVLKLITESKKRVDLILSGHTHAGQMLVVWPLSFFSNRFFFGHYYYPDTDTQIYVSSGVNYWGPPIKMPNLCEVANVRLHRTVSDVVVNQADSVAEPIQ